MIALHLEQRIRSFFFGQYLANALKITLGILVPSLVFAWMEKLEYGLVISLGAFYVSLADQPGPVIHRRNGMLAAILSIFITVTVTGLIYQISWLLAVEIFVFCFLFSFLTVFGSRASAVGMAALLMMISSMHIGSMGISLRYYSLLIMAGGIWYLLLSLSLNQMRPYRQAQQLLGEGVLEVAKYLKLKGDFYDDAKEIEKLYKQLVMQQVVVNNHLDAVRQIILRTRRKVRETMKSGRLVMMIFIDIVESFELAMSTHHDYDLLRKKYAKDDILPDLHKLVLKIAIEYEDLGYALINNQKPRPLRNFKSDLKAIKDKINVLESEGVSVLTLKKTLVNARNMTRLLEDMYNYFLSEKLTFLSKTEEADLTKFISHQELDWKKVRSNLTFSSTVFRHSIRLAFTCLLGYLIITWFAFGQQSYLILVTILVIQKPDFVLSKERNLERLIGSVIGGLLGASVLLWVDHEAIRLLLLIIFMILSFSFNRVYYVVGVLFMTALVLILFSLISDSDNLDLTGQRILYTIIGSGIAFLSSYFILPVWESSLVRNHLANTLKANLAYFKAIISRFSNTPSPATDLKLVRKDVFTETARLGAAFQNILNEPKHKKENLPYINEFVILNHILSSYLASLSSTMEETEDPVISNHEYLKLIQKTRVMLQEAISRIDAEPYKVKIELPDIPKNAEEESSDDLFLGRQLRLIAKVAGDIEKLTKKHFALPADEKIASSENLLVTAVAGENRAAEKEK